MSAEQSEVIREALARGWHEGVLYAAQHRGDPYVHLAPNPYEDEGDSIKTDDRLCSLQDSHAHHAWLEPSVMRTCPGRSRRLRPECCPECREVGICDADCTLATVNGWPRESADA